MYGNQISIIEQFQQNRKQNRRTYTELNKSNPLPFQIEKPSSKKLKLYPKLHSQQPLIEISNKMVIDSIDYLHPKPHITTRKEIPQKYYEYIKAYKNEISSKEKGIKVCECYDQYCE